MLFGAFLVVGFFHFSHSASAAYNLVRNPGAETVDLRSWTLTNAGDSGWSITGGDYAHSGLYSFLGSFNLDTMSQEIDLTAWGYTAEALDAEPSITASAYAAGHWPNGADTYRMVVELRDASHAAIASYDTGTLTAGGIATWSHMTHTFTEYGTGARYVYIRLEGNDAEFWAGNYGTVFDDVSVTVAGTGPTLLVTAPGAGQTISTWSPVVNWGNSVACWYSYNDHEYTAANCAAGGSDIPQTTTSLSPTLYLVGINAAGGSTATSSSFTQEAANDLTFGLVGHWKFDEATADTCAGGADACDASGNANHGTYGGTPTASVTVPEVRFSDPYSLSFNGTNNYVSVARPVADDFTICAWIKTATAGNTTNHWQTAPIFDAEVPGVANDFGFGVDSNGRIAYGNGGLYDATVNGAVSVIDNDWHHACVTRAWATREVKLYVDGVLDVTGSTHSARLNSSTNARIGYGLDGASAKYFNGLIDDVRVYERVLSSGNINLLAQGYATEDVIPPVITRNGAAVVEIITGAQYLDAGATAADDTDGDITNAIIVGGAVNTTLPGTYVVTYDVADGAGNAATQITRTVVVLPAGFGLPVAALASPAVPVGGYAISVQGGQSVVTNPLIGVASNGGLDIGHIALSLTPDFKDIGLREYRPVVFWNLCGVAPTCVAGTYTVYVKFYTLWGRQSSVQSFTVEYRPASVRVLGEQTSTGLVLARHITRTLVRGSRGDAVLALQTILAQDASIYPEAQVTGYFGPATLRAVQAFQIKHKIVTRGSVGFGVVGPTTRAKLFEIFGGK
ncbi:MAG: DUF5011 domain-containing protein [Candidatus Doudnabacteria bacterium]|nr:DUF5011 domain-containing protein [Candidatus Doudnabacteria bacterium]